VDSGWLQALLVGGTAVAGAVAVVRSFVAHTDRRGRAGLTGFLVALWSIRPGRTKDDQDYALKLIWVLKTPPTREATADCPAITPPSSALQRASPPPAAPELSAVVHDSPKRRRSRSRRPAGPVP
jgi:hypothetical protein